MKIATKFRLGIACAAILLTVVCYLNWRITCAVNKAVADHGSLEMLMFKAFDLQTLLQDFQVDFSERTQQQWEQKYADLALLITDMEVAWEAEGKLLGAVEKKHQDLGELYQELKSLFNRANGFSSNPEQQQQQITNRLINQMSLVSHAMVRRIEEYGTLNFDRLVVKQKSGALLLTLVITISSLFFLYVFFLLRQSITSPLEKLMTGVGQIGKGDLEYRIEMSRNDEFKDLAQAFNRMTTELKRSQDRIVRQEKLATIGRLAASVRHDLRNPLGVISNSVYFLKMKLGGAEEKVLKHLELMTQEIDACDRIISELLDFSKVMTPVYEQCDLYALVKESFDYANVPENISVVKRWTDKDACIVSVDKNQIKRVVTNLISNACKAMPHGGELTIAIKRSDNTVALRVEDTGVGIRPDDVDNIFDPLFTRSSKGSGMGLAIAKNYVELHRGRIEVESREGKGSAFTVNLPVGSIR